jgi:hypothetical protein
LIVVSLYAAREYLVELKNIRQRLSTGEKSTKGECHRFCCDFAEQCRSIEPELMSHRLFVLVNLLSQRIPFRRSRS